jgi:hypothetical protein
MGTSSLTNFAKKFPPETFQPLFKGNFSSLVYYTGSSSPAQAGISRSVDFSSPANH